MSMIRLVVDPIDPDPDAVAEAASAIRAGGLVVFPTDTLYGLAADPFNQAAVERIFRAKARDAERGLPLVASDAAQIAAQLGALPPAAQRLAERFWPGPLTILVSAAAELPEGVSAGTARVGVRVPAHAVARALCRVAQSVLIATSANLSGEPATHEPERLSAPLLAHVGVLLDAGPTAGGPPSTIIDLTSGTARLIRAGAIPFDVIQACLG
jgi:L-threonylcarbamoyladenylate synthase